MASHHLTSETSCSIGECMDALLSCIRFSSQVKNYYRYGTYKPCGSKWEDLKVCVSSKLKDEETAKELIRQRHLQLEAEKAKRPSSLDVWELRDSPPLNFPPQNL